MKTKLLIPTIFFFATFLANTCTVYSQLLPNTTWATYDTTSTLFVYFHFNSDTLSYSPNNSSYTNVATYTENSNNFNVVDLSTGPCPVSDTGKYTILIQNDTLKFTLISDPCTNRTETFLNYYWLKVISSSIFNLSSAMSINIFPNPFSTQTILQSDIFLHNATLTVNNCFGQTVREIKNISGQTVTFHRDNLATGLYFVRLTQDNQVIAADKLVITDK